MRISDWSSDVCSSDLFGKDAIGRFLDSLRRLRALDPRAKCVADRRVERRAALEQVERLDPLAPVAVPDQRVETLHAVRAAGIGSDLRRQAEEARGAGDALPGLEMAMLAIGEAILFRRVLVALSRRDPRLPLLRPILVEHLARKSVV